MMNAHWHTSPNNSQYEPPGGDTFNAATRYWPPNHLGFAATGRWPGRSMSARHFLLLTLAFCRVTGQVH